jgi:septum formation protein
MVTNLSSLWLAPSPLLLASKSSARRHVLEAAALPVEIEAADIDERAVEMQSRLTDPAAVAMLLARSKATAVAVRHPERLVLGADQTLALEQRRFSKPADRDAAAAQLRALSGKTHYLHSAICLVHENRIVFEYRGVAKLTMRVLSDAMIDTYLDAAGSAALASVGAYQIEGIGIHLFDSVEGDHFTILGLPLLPLLDYLRREGWVAT